LAAEKKRGDKNIYKADRAARVFNNLVSMARSDLKLRSTQWLESARSIIKRHKINAAQSS